MEQADLLRKVIGVLEESRVRYMLVGSIASSAYGEPRMTQDIDIVIEVEPEEITRLCEQFPQEEFYVNSDAARQAAREGGQFNVINPTSGNKIDFMIARTDSWGRAQLARRLRICILPDREGFAATPEDIIIGKMIYYRDGGPEKHLRDITGMLKVSGGDIDRQYVAQWAEELDLTDIWQAILGRIGDESSKDKP